MEKKYRIRCTQWWFTIHKAYVKILFSLLWIPIIPDRIYTSFIVKRCSIPFRTIEEKKPQRSESIFIAIDTSPNQKEAIKIVLFFLSFHIFRFVRLGNYDKCQANEIVGKKRTIIGYNSYCLYYIRIVMEFRVERVDRKVACTAILTHLPGDREDTVAQ